MFGWGGEGFYAHDAFEDGGGLGVFGRCGNDTGAVDEIDAFGEGDVLPDLGFSRDGRNGTDFAAFERVDNAAFSNVGIPDEPY